MAMSTPQDAAPASPSSALVLFSGGQDSTVCLAWALERYACVETVGFDYGQRHRIELEVRRPILDAMRQLRPEWNGRLGEDRVLALPSLPAIGATALTSDMEIVLKQNRLPNTFVPGRNLLFFTYAAAVACRRGIDTLVGGMCETDYSGYPDCRDETLQTLGRAISLGMDKPFNIETPLMWLDKAGTWAMTREIGGDELVGLVRDLTHTCYLGIRTRTHDWGAGCGHCPACDLRRKGWEKWKANSE